MVDKEREMSTGVLGTMLTGTHRKYDTLVVGDMPYLHLTICHISARRHTIFALNDMPY